MQVGVRGLMALGVLLAAVPVHADEEQTRPEIAACTRSLGAITIVDGDRRGWSVYDLQSPQKLLKLYVQKSGCFTLLDRGAGFDAAQRERDLEAGGALQPRSIGGGGLRTRDLEAQAILSITDVRTCETKAVTEGRARKTDVSFALGAGGGGWGGWGGVVGGGYENTPTGQVVSLAFLEAFKQMVGQLGALPADAKSAAQERAYQTVRATKVRKFPDPGATVVRNLDPGMRLYPLGDRDGLWWKVEDDNGNQGWGRNTDLEPLR